VIDPKILSTLPKREYISGFAEIIKHGAICDRSFYDLVTSKQPLQFNDIEMADIIYKSCVIKKNITEQDRTERGMRKLLNFGHTVGHALEIQTLQGTNPLLHGEAVSIGMVAEAMIAVAVGKLSSSDLSLLTESLTNAGLPIACAGLELNGLISSMRSDKKNEGQALHFTLIDRLGHAEIDQIVAEEVVDGVLQALNEASL
jgi:3-dehydroquinate synthase